MSCQSNYTFQRLASATRMRSRAAVPALLPPLKTKLFRNRWMPPATMVVGTSSASTTTRTRPPLPPLLGIFPTRVSQKPACNSRIASATSSYPKTWVCSAWTRHMYSQYQHRLFSTSLPASARPRKQFTVDVTNRLLEGRRNDISLANLARQEGIDRCTMRRWLLELVRPYLRDAKEPAPISSISSATTDHDHNDDNLDPDVSAYPLLVSAVKRPWTASERDKLCMLAVNVRSWDKIAQVLDRDVLTCREKYHQLNREMFGTALHMPASRKKNPYWAELRALGFTPTHRDRLVKALKEQQTRARSSSSGAGGGGSGGGGRGGSRGSGNDDNDDAATSLDHLFGQATSQRRTTIDMLPGGDGSLHTSGIDWNAAAEALGYEFSPDQLHEVYKILAKARLIWTEQEDARLIQVMIRRGGGVLGRGRSSSESSSSSNDSTGGSATAITASDELQERVFWAEVRDSFGDPFRTPEDYKARWRMLDMPLLDRNWDATEQVKFWRRFLEFHQLGSLINPRLAKARGGAVVSKDVKDGKVQDGRGRMAEDSGEQSMVENGLVLDKAALMQDTFMWDTIAEGIEYRHGRDCQAYFESKTQLFPRDDPELFGFLVMEVAQRYLRPPRAPWTEEDAQTVYEMASSYRARGELISWSKIVTALNSRYTEQQVKTKYMYLVERAKTDRWVPMVPSVSLTALASSSASGDGNGNSHAHAGQTDTTNPSTSISTSQLAETASTNITTMPTVKSRTLSQQRWTDKELELLLLGMAKYDNTPQRLLKVQQEFLPHRTRYQIRERYDRTLANAHGRFTGKEQRLLEEAVEFLGGSGEEVSWEEVAQMVPGRSASQCRQAWNYGSIHYHIGRSMTGGGTKWLPQDHERLMEAIDRYGTRQWSKVAEIVVGKTPTECRNEWRLKCNPAANFSKWSQEEVDLLMERVSEYLTKQDEAEYEARVAVMQHQTNGETEAAAATAAGSGSELEATVKTPDDKVFSDPRPRYKGKVKIDWHTIAEGVKGRSPLQCYQKFQSQRKTYRMLGEF